MNLSLSHIAIANPKISEIARKLAVLGLKIEKEHEVPTEKVKAAMVPVEFSPHFRIELLEPTSEESPLAGFLKKRPEGGIHHVCFEVSDLKRWKEVLEKEGLVILPPGIRKAARGEALFIHPKSMGGVLVELEEIHQG